VFVLVRNSRSRFHGHITRIPPHLWIFLSVLHEAFSASG
jgi:hypothetical protein